MKTINLQIIVKDLPESLFFEIKDRVQFSLKAILEEYSDRITSEFEMDGAVDVTKKE